MGAGTYFSKYAYLIVVNLVQGEVVEEFKLRHQIYEESTKGFTGASLDRQNGTLWVTTEAEIFELSLNPIRVIKRTTKPFLNDVHHVYVDDSSKEIFVSNTGLDTVEIFDLNLNHKKSVSLLKKWRYLKTGFKQFFFKKTRRKIKNFLLKLKRFSLFKAEKFWQEDMRYKHLSKNIFLADFYKLFFPNVFYSNKFDLRYTIFRPHILHPNHIFKIGNQYLVTLKNTGEVVDLDTKEVVLSNLKGVHDGILKKGLYILTQADLGYLSYCIHTEEDIDFSNKKLLDIEVCSPKEGFVRGVDLFEDNIVAVTVSKRREIGDDSPAYIALFNLDNQRFLNRFEIPLKYGTNPYSILDVTEKYC
jgi:hypothetical protein